MSAAALNQCRQPIGVLSVEASTPVAWSTDGSHLAAVGGNGSIFILELGKDLLFHMSKLLPGHKHGVKALLFHPTNANVLVSAGVDGIFVHDLALGAVTLVVSHKTPRELGLDTTASALLGTADGAHDGDVECMTWAYDGGCLITGGKDASVKVWDTAAASPAAWRLLETVSGHKAPVLAVEYCPAVQRFASAGRDASIKLWDASTLALDHRPKRADDGGIVVTLLGTCESHGDVICLLWAPDGSHIVSGSRDNGVRIWSSSSFSEIREVSDKRLGQAGKHRSDVRKLAYLPPVPGTPTATEGAAGRRFLLSCSLDGSMRLWLLEPVVEVESTTATIFNSGDGPGTAEKRGAGAGAGAGADPTAASSGLGSPDALLGLVEGAAGLGLGLGDAGSIGTGASGGWDDVTRKLLGEIMGSGGLSTAAVTGKGSQGGVDSCLATMAFFGGENASRGAAEDGVSAFALNPAQPIVAYASSAHAFALGKLRLDTLEWLLRQKAGTLPPNALPPGTSLDPVAQVQAFYGHTGAVNAVQLIGDDRTLVTASNDYTAAVYDIASVERRLLLPYGTSVHCLALGAPLSAGGAPLVYVGGADYAIRGYSSNPADYEPIRRAYASKAGGPEPVPAWEFQAVRYLGHSGRVESIAVDAKNRVMASAGRDWSVLLWDLTRPAPALSAVARSFEDEVPTGAPMARVDAHRGHIASIRFSSLEAGGLLATAGSDHAVKVWRISSGLTGTGLSSVWESGPKAAGGHSSAVSALAWGKGDAETQRLLFSGAWDCSIKVWAGTKANKLSPAAAQAAAAAAAGSALEEAPSAGDVAPLRSLKGHTSRITDLEVASGGDVLVSTSADGTARVWKVREPFACIAMCVLSPGDGVPTSVSVGTHIFVTGCDTGCHVWPLRPHGPFGAYYVMMPSAPASVAGSSADGVGALAAGGSFGGPGGPGAVAGGFGMSSGAQPSFGIGAGAAASSCSSPIGAIGRDSQGTRSSTSAGVITIMPHAIAKGAPGVEMSPTADRRSGVVVMGSPLTTERRTPDDALEQHPSSAPLLGRHMPQ